MYNDVYISSNNHWWNKVVKLSGANRQTRNISMVKIKCHGKLLQSGGVAAP